MSTRPTGPTHWLSKANFTKNATESSKATIAIQLSQRPAKRVSMSQTSGTRFDLNRIGRRVCCLS